MRSYWPREPMGSSPGATIRVGQVSRGSSPSQSRPLMSATKRPTQPGSQAPVWRQKPAREARIGLPQEAADDAVAHEGLEADHVGARDAETVEQLMRPRPAARR
jgi:hypothetical protein